MSVLLQTSLGDIVIDLYIEEAPEECNNFLKLCKAKYYQFAPIYDIQRNYHCAIGNPTYPSQKEGISAWGLAGYGKLFKARRNKLHHDNIGRVSYVTQTSATDPDALYASSLINIVLGDVDERRTNLAKNVVFGQVAEGFGILAKINGAVVDDHHDPLQDIRIHHIIILDDPFDDIENLPIPLATPEPTEEQIRTIRLEDIEPLNLEQTTETEDELKRKQQEETKSKALTLEIIGDLPSAEVKPMENVLFVCKLNPVTKSEDLEIIFARFGKIISCEVIKDSDTGQSLQYAFIEYDEKKSCEAAYFKMDGVLIDDRRIHVDFSQSVSKLADVWRSKTSERRRLSFENRREHNTKNLSRSTGRSDYGRAKYNYREKADSYHEDRRSHSRYDDEGNKFARRNEYRWSDMDRERSKYDRDQYRSDRYRHDYRDRR